ncbi:hypothetical protein GC173_08745 [bacterium]|nr:hypothetical protein [bacterium]
MAWKNVYLKRNDGSQSGPHPLEYVIIWNHRGELAADVMLVDVETGETRWPNELTQIPMPQQPVSSASGHKKRSGPRLIPKNGPAVLGYYLAFGSAIGMIVFCIPGVVAGIAAVVCGIKGLSHFRENPDDGGRIHSWVAIILGGLFALGSLVGAALFALSIANQ